MYATEESHAPCMATNHIMPREKPNRKTDGYIVVNSGASQIKHVAAVTNLDVLVILLKFKHLVIYYWYALPNLNCTIQIQTFTTAGAWRGFFFWAVLDATVPTNAVTFIKPLLRPWNEFHSPFTGAWRRDLVK